MNSQSSRAVMGEGENESVLLDDSFSSMKVIVFELVSDTRISVLTRSSFVKKLGDGPGVNDEKEKRLGLYCMIICEGVTKQIPTLLSI